MSQDKVSHDKDDITWPNIANLNNLPNLTLLNLISSYGITEFIILISVELNGKH